MKIHCLIFPLIIVFLAACEGEQTAPPGADSPVSGQNDPVSVRLTEIQPDTFHHYISIQGAVESDKTIMISPKVAGTVERIHVKVGDRVGTGQTLAILDGEVTRSQIEEIQTRLELAREVFQRRKNLREKDVGSEVQYLEAKNNVEALESQLATLRKRVDNFTVKSGISGRVSKVLIKEGETASPAAPAFQVSNSEELKVTAEISEAYISSVDETDFAELTFPSIDHSIETKIDVVNEVIDPDNRTFGIEIFLSNPPKKILPNMMAKMKINDYTAGDVLIVSVNNIHQSNGDKFLYTVHQTDSTAVAKKQIIQTGKSYEDQIIVSRGLEAGDRVISVGDSDLSDNDPVKIVE